MAACFPIRHTGTKHSPPDMTGLHNRRSKGIPMDKQDLVSRIKSRSAIKDPTTAAFESTGRLAAEEVHGRIKKYFPGRQDLAVLDFGSGSGRVAIPLARLLQTKRLCCVDVDREAVEYIALELGASCETGVNGYLPPLAFGDHSFDFVYSISVWSHLPEDLSLAWLAEMHRIVKPGGVVLITVAGETVLEHWKKTDAAQWQDVTVDEFNTRKFVYREYPHIQHNEKTYPGISGKGSWGNTLIHPDYIRAKWSHLFDILEIAPRGMNGRQDIVVLRSKGP